MNVARAFRTCLLAITILGTVTTVTSTAAQATQNSASATPAARQAGAAQPHDCPYPYVCLYKDGVRIGQFRDVTSTYQNLPSRPSGPNLRLVNTRNDDTVWIRYSTGSTICLLPKADVVWENSGSVLTGIRISSSPTCGV